MKIFLVTAPGHENTGYGDGLIEGSHPDVLVSFLRYQDRISERRLAGFLLSDPAGRPPLAQVGPTAAMLDIFVDDST